MDMGTVRSEDKKENDCKYKKHAVEKYDIKKQMVVMAFCNWKVANSLGLAAFFIGVRLKNGLYRLEIL